MSALDTYSGNFIVMDGTTDVSTGHGVVYSVVSEVGCDVTIDASTGEYTIESFTSDSATAQFKAEYNGVEILKNFSLAKSRTGATGASGTAISGLLSNESVTVAADSGGTVSSFSGSGGVFQVFEGITDVTTGGSVTFSVVSETGVDVSINSVGVYTVSSMSANQGTATFRAVYGGVTINKVFSIAKSLAGAAGANGTGTSNAPVLIYKRSATSSPTLPSASTTYTFATGVLTGLNNSWTQAIPSGTDPLYVSQAIASAATPTDTIASSEWATAVKMVENGANGTNGADGLNTAFVNIYQRATSAPSVPSVTATYTFATGGITGLNNGWTATIPAGTNPIYTTKASVIATGTTDTILTGEWQTPVVLSQNGADGAAGTAGSNNASILIYQRGTVAPTLPSATTTFTFATGALTGLTNGWTTTIPAGTSDLYVARAAASASTATDTIAAGEWSSPVVLVSNGVEGEAGSDGLNQATVHIYQRSASTPTLPSVTSTYTFATGALTGLNNGWTRTIPAGSLPCYVTQASAISVSTSDTVLSSEWAAPTVMVQDGSNAKTVMVIADRQTVKYDAAGVATPTSQTTTFTAQKQNTSGTVTWSVTDIAGVARTPVTTYLSAATGDTVTMTEAQFAAARNSTEGVIVTGTVTADSISDKISVTRISNGNDAKLIYLTSTQQTFSYSTTGAAIAQTTTLTATRTNTTATTAWKLYKADGTTVIYADKAAMVTAGFSFPTNDTCTVTHTLFTSVCNANSTSGLVFEVSVVDGTTITDRLSIVKIQDGAQGPAGNDGIEVRLTRPVAVLPSDSSGNVSSYAQATGAFVAVQGTTDVSSNFTLSTVADPQALSKSYVGQTYSVTGGFDASEDTASLTIRATGSGAFAGKVYDLIFGLSKSKQGVDGLNDVIAPSQVTGLAASSAVVTEPDGSSKVTVTLTWTASAATDLSHYRVAAKETAQLNTSYVETMAGKTNATFVYSGLKSNTSYDFKVAAVDIASNVGAFSTVVTHVTAKDNVAPGAPTSPAATASFQTIYLAWVNPVATDLAKVEIWENAANSSGTATRIATVNAQSGANGGFARSGLSSGITRYYWLKAVDTSGNASAFTTVVSATTASVPATDISGTLADAQIAALSASKVTGTLSDAQLAAISAAKITGQITSTQITDNSITTAKINAGAITAAKIATDTITANEIAANAITSSELNAGAVVAGKIAAGTIVAADIAAATITGAKIAAGTIAASNITSGTITSTQIAAGTITSDRIQAGTITGDRLLSSTSLPATLTIGSTGFNLGVVQQGADNSRNVLNAGAVNSNGNFTSVAGDGRPAGWFATDTSDIPANIHYKTGTTNVLELYSASDTTVAMASAAFRLVSNVTYNIKVRANALAATTGSLYVRIAEYDSEMPLGTNFVGVGLFESGGVTNTRARTIGIEAVNVGTTATEYETTYVPTSTAKWASLLVYNNIAGQLWIEHALVLNAATTGAPTGTNVGSTAATTVETRANDPAARINAHTTTVDAGKILVSGSTTLANWRNGSDNTKIEGGSIAANTIAANKISLGQRGVELASIEFTTNGVNAVSCSAGWVIYTNDAGSIITQAIAATTFAAWSSGQTQYFYYEQGASSIVMTTSNTVLGQANRIVLALYRGTNDLVVNYGRTIIDGDHIKTGTITATQIAANTITGTQILAGSINADRITAGTLTASRFLLDNGVDLGAIVNGALNTSSVASQSGTQTLYVQLNSVTQTAVLCTTAGLTIQNDTDTVLINASVNVTNPTSRGSLKLQKSTDGSTWTDWNYMHNVTGGVGTGTRTYPLAAGSVGEHFDHTAGQTLYFRILMTQQGGQSTGDGTAGVTNFSCTGSKITVRKFFSK